MGITDDVAQDVQFGWHTFDVPCVCTGPLEYHEFLTSLVSVQLDFAEATFTDVADEGTLGLEVSVGKFVQVL